MKLSLLFIFIVSLAPVISEARNKVDLGDIDIKGQLHNDGRLSILAREQNQLKNYIKFRTNYRREIIEELPQPEPGVTKKFR